MKRLNYMGSYQKTGLCLILISSILLGAYLHAAETVFFREDFENLDGWEALFFRGIDRHTTYSSQHQDGASVLVAKSSDSASALVHKRTFNVAEYPLVRWCWKVDNLYADGNYRLKSGDDYPNPGLCLF